MALQIDIPYGSGIIGAALPDRTFVVSSAGGEKPVPVKHLEAEVRSALSQPMGLPRIETLARPGHRVTIAFDDPTVPSYGPIRGIAIRDVLRRLEKAGVGRDSITLVCANALHRKFRPDELAVILGRDLIDEVGERLICHDAEDPENLVNLGRTASGCDVEISRHVAESDLTVYVNSAHYRGFMGGWKSICVGLSTFRSIRHHHTPDGMSMSLRDNPMHRILDEMGEYLEARVAGTIFKIDTIEADPFQTAHVFAGSTRETRKAAVGILSRYFSPRRDLSRERFDVILYGVPDWSPYAIFSHMNPILTLISSGLGYLGGTIQALGKPGCSVIMVTPCPERWDRVHHPTYPEIWHHVLAETRDPYLIAEKYTARYASDPDGIEKYRYHYAFHPVHGILATQPLKRLRHCGTVMVAGIENPDVARHLGFVPTETVSEALALAETIHGNGYSIAYARHPAAPTKTGM